MAFTFFFRDQQVLERVVDRLLPAIAGRNGWPPEAQRSMWDENESKILALATAK